jgi:hypothetical protein
MLAPPVRAAAAGTAGNQKKISQNEFTERAWEAIVLVRPRPQHIPLATATSYDLNSSNERSISVPAHTTVYAALPRSEWRMLV